MRDYSSIEGHAVIKDRLRGYISEDHVGHAYIFEGGDTAGRDGLAEVFAEALLCEKGGAEPCGHCSICSQTASGNCPDLIYVTADPSKKSGGIGVDDIRKTLADTASILPYASKYKVYIVKDAENMTPEAQNALLKTLEEPPAYVVIMLLCDEAVNLLPTVRSRCEILNVGTLNSEKICEELISEGLADAAKASLCAALSAGDPMKAKELAQSEKFDDISFQTLSALKDLGGMNMGKVHRMMEAMKQDKKTAELILRIIRLWFKDVMVFKATGDVDIVTLREDIRFIRKTAEQNDYRDIESSIEAVSKAQMRLNANVNQDLTMELLLLSLKENIK